MGKCGHNGVRRFGRIKGGYMSEESAEAKWFKDFCSCKDETVETLN